MAPWGWQVEETFGSTLSGACFSQLPVNDAIATARSEQAFQRVAEEEGW